MAKAVLLKRCPGCPPETALQPIENFHRLASAEDGRQNACKTCQRDRRMHSYDAGKQREYRKKRRDIIRPQQVRATRRWRARKSSTNNAST